MFQNYKLSVVIFLFGLLSVLPSSAQSVKSVWSPVSASQLASEVKWSRKTEPTIASYYNIDIAAIKLQLLNAPQRGVSSSVSTTIIDYPTSEGIERFRVKEASIMAEELQAKYPDFRSYVGQSITSPSNQIRFSITSQGFHGMMFSAQKGLQFVDSYTLDNNSVIVYKKKDLIDHGDHWECHVDDDFGLNQRVSGPQLPIDLKNANDGVMRDFRLAISTTIEYSSFHWTRAGVSSTDPDATKRAAVMAAMVVTMTRNNFVYERDLSITMTFVANNDLLISIGTDNFSNNNASAILTENQAAVNSVIGFNNYDIGHIFSTGGGGLASLSSPCTSRKAQAVTGRTSPVGDPFDIDFVAHEIGHQMGAPHSFNGNASSCAGGNRSSNNAYEPGSGTTIMAYAGICPPQNVQNNSDAYFHQVSLSSIFNNVSRGQSTCAQTTVSGNAAPTAMAGSNYLIPSRTPYKLVGNSTDSDGTTSHTYTWEQFDLGTSGLPTNTSTTGPLVRSIEGTTEKTRYIPTLPEIVSLGGVSTTWEKLASVTRVQNFRLTVRDNDSRGGQTAVDAMALQVVSAAGPFRVTSQNTSGIVWLPNTTETITWDVAGTDANGINASQVNILLSTDNGVSFDTVLASAVPNTGSYDLTVPGGIVSATCRIMIEGNNNVFFNVNSETFNVNASVQSVCTVYSSGSVNGSIPDGTATGGAGALYTNDINVSQSGSLDSVTVTTDVSHTYIQDLVMTLTNPQGTNFSALWDQNCLSQDNLNITFDDNGGAIACASPTIGIVSPVTPLSAFTGVETLGNWTINISDNFSGDTGTLNSWSVEICTLMVTPLSNESFELDNLSIYPNPSNGNFNILFDNANSNDIGIDIFDLSGRSVFSKSYETASSFNQNINLTGVSSGMYLVNIIDGNHVVTKKIIIE